MVTHHPQMKGLAVVADLRSIETQSNNAASTLPLLFHCQTGCQVVLLHVAAEGSLSHELLHQ